MKIRANFTMLGIGSFPVLMTADNIDKHATGEKH